MAHGMSAQQLYLAYFGRPGDAEGYDNLAAALDALLPADANNKNIVSLKDAYFRGLEMGASSADMQIVETVTNFSASPESQALFGNITADPTAFVTAVFQNAFGRAPATEGLNFWVNEINNGLDPAGAALAIIAGAFENPAATADQTAVANKTVFAQAFTDILRDDAEAAAAYVGADAAQIGRDYLVAVDENTDVAGADAAATASVQEVVAAQPGETFMLTTGTDTLVGTERSDTFTSATGTLQSADRVVDNNASDSDSLNLTFRSADTNTADVGTQATAQIEGVENININLDLISGGAFNALNTKGATITASSGRLGFDGNFAATNVAANNVTAGSNVKNLDVADLTTGVVNAGSAETVAVDTVQATDTANITVNGDVALTITTATSAAITGTANAEIDLTAAAVTKLTVAGTGNTVLLADDLSGDEIVNSKTAGTLTASVSAGADVGDWDVDNILVTAAAALTGVGAAPVEIATADLTVSAAGLDPLESDVVISTALDQTSITVTNSKSATVNLTDEVVVGTLGVGAIDTTLNVSANAEVVALTSTGEVAITGSGDVTIGGTEATLVDASSLVGKLDLVSTLVDSFEAMAGTAGSDIEIATTTGTAAITGGAGSDVVDAASITTGTVVFEGGAGSDSLLVSGNGAQTIVFDGGSGTDTLILAAATDLGDATTTLAGVEAIKVEGTTATVKASTLSGNTFTVNGNGVLLSSLVAEGTAMADTINLSGITAPSVAGAGGATIAVLGGAGNDLITLSANASDVVILGNVTAAGIDTVTGFSTANDRLDFNEVDAIVNLVSGEDAVVFTKGTAVGQFADLNAVLATFAAGEANELGLDDAAFFQFDGKTYVAIDGGLAGYDAGADAVVELVGVDVNTFGLNNFIDLVA